MADPRREDFSTSSSVQLKLFPSAVLIDQCVSYGNTELKKLLRNWGLVVIHATDVGMSAADDAALAGYGHALEAVTITSDYGFHWQAARAQALPGTVIWLPQSDDRSSVTPAAEFIRTIATTDEGDDRVKFAYFDPVMNTSVEWDVIIPPILLPVLILLESRGEEGVANKDLRDSWGCCRETARKRARCLVGQRWLSTKGTAGGTRYCMGSRLRAIKELGKNLKRGGQQPRA